MLISFFECLRQEKVPVSVRELMDLLQALRARLAFADLQDFYHLARLTLVKDEVHYDKFDRAYAAFLEGLPAAEQALTASLPEDWLRREIEKLLSAEDLANLQGMGSLQALLDAFRERLREQEHRHQGGQRMIGTGGTSPFGAYGAHPEGIRLAGPSRLRRAVKVWEAREFHNLDDREELAPRHIKLALRRLRKFTRRGQEEELDIDDTIHKTAHQGGWLDLRMRPPRRNAINVLLFLDVGGSMDDHVRIVEDLFAAARSEFKHLQYFYFHNFIYEGVWQDNARRWSERTSVYDILHRYGPDYRVIFVGDATMSPYEVVSPGGSVEHFNQEPGAVWMTRLAQHFQRLVWLNPHPAAQWRVTASTVRILELIGEQRMFELNLAGLEAAMRQLAR